MLVWVALNVLGWSGGVRFFCGDETRLGLKTLGGRKITAKGVKPVGQVQWQFKATYIYGIVEPKTGEHFFFEFSHLNTDCFQVFLNLVSQQFQNDLLIIQLDNGGFHKAKRLKVPSNIILLFQPPHCPELNPIEQVWQYLKRRLRSPLTCNARSVASTVARTTRSTDTRSGCIDHRTTIHFRCSICSQYLENWY